MSYSRSLRPSASGLSRSATYSAVGSASASTSQRSRTPLKYVSQVEQAVVNSQTPLRLPNAGRIQAGQYSGLHLNKDEELVFRGPRPLSQYQINQDTKPEVIRKQSAPVKYTQQVSVRRLNPPTPAPHGDLIVREVQQQIPAGPPVVVRQEGRRAATPPPLVYREAPPRPPTRIPTQTGVGMRVGTAMRASGNSHACKSSKSVMTWASAMLIKWCIQDDSPAS